MKYLFSYLFLCFISLPLANAKNVIDWKYKSFPVLQQDSRLKQNEPHTLVLSDSKLSAIMSRKSGTHRFWGVDQVYLNPKSQKQKLFIKYNVEISAKAPIDGWVTLNKGQILHLKQQNKKYTAYFAQGFSNRELLDLQKQFKKNHVALQQNYSWLIPCANAEVTDTTGYDAFLEEPPRTDSSSSLLARAENVMTCVGAEAIDKAVERGKALWESATWENVRNTAGAAWDAVPTLEEAGNGIAAGASWVWDRVSDPVETWNRVVDSFDKTKQIFAQIYQEVSTSLAGFRDLPPDVQDEIVCHIVAQLAVDGALGVALGATGAGATVAIVRLMNAVRRLTTSLVAKLPRIRALIEQNPQDMVEATRRILKEGSDISESPTLETAQSRPTAPALDSELLTEGADTTSRAALLARNGALNLTERIAEAEKLLGRNLSDAEKNALAQAHEVAPERGFGTYTRADLNEKARILRSAGFSRQEIDQLMRSGLAGRPNGAVPEDLIKISQNSRDFKGVALSNAQREVQELQTLIQTQASIDGNVATYNGVTFYRLKDAGGTWNWSFSAADTGRVQAILRETSTVSPRIPFAQRHPTEVVVTQADTRFQQVVSRNAVGNSTKIRNLLDAKAPNPSIGDSVVINGITFYRRLNNSRAPIWTFDISDAERVRALLDGL